MALTLPNISIPAGAWVDLYAASGIPVGTKISVQNLSYGDVRLAAKATAPTDKDGYALLQFGRAAPNQAGDTGAWAMSPIGSIVNVAIA